VRKYAPVESDQLRELARFCGVQPSYYAVSDQLHQPLREVQLAWFLHLAAGDAEFLLVNLEDL